LQSEVVKSINGESKFEPAVLNELIAQTKDKIQSSSEKAGRYQSELDNRQQYLIKSVKVTRGYNLDIALNVAYEQFFNAP